MLKRIKPNVNFQMNHWSTRRSQEVVFRRLRLGSGRCLKEFLWKIGKHGDGKCDVCGVRDNVEHFLLYCARFKNQREVLSIKMQNLGFDQYGIEELFGGNNPPFNAVVEYVHQTGIDL